MDAFESQLQILLKDNKERPVEKKNNSHKRLPVDVPRAPLLPVELWNEFPVSAPRNHSTKSMCFVYEGALLAGQMALEAGEEEEDSDSYVEAKDDYDAEGAGGEVGGVWVGADEARFGNIFEPIYAEDLAGKAAIEQDERGDGKHAAEDQATSQAAAAVSYYRAGLWARPAERAASIDPSAPLLRSGHSLVSFPVAIPTQSHRPSACRAAPSRSETRQNDPQYVSPSTSQPHSNILHMAALTAPSPAPSRSCRRHSVRWLRWQCAAGGFVGVERVGEQMV